MSNHIGANLVKYRHIIVIAIAVAALGSYFLPLNAVFAGHNNANQAARDSILKGKSGTGTSSSGPSKTTSTSTSNTGNPNTKRIPSGHDGPNGAQIGGPDDNGNIGHNNLGTDNTGNGNNGVDNVGNFNNGGPPGHIGNFCGNGVGHHYGCLIHNPHAP